MFSFLFNRNKRSEGKYTILARYRSGHWFKQFTVTAYDSYEAARKFDQGGHDDWVRVSGATLCNPLFSNNESI